MASRVSAEAHVPHTLDTVHDKSRQGSVQPITVHDEADVIEVTHQRPYGEINFIGTYIAVGLGALACYGSFVMPATSLALIEAEIGTNTLSRPTYVHTGFANIAIRWQCVGGCLDCPLLDSVLICRLRPCRPPF